MTDQVFRRSIRQALAACAVGPLATSARDLLDRLGYRSERWVDIGDPAEFLDTFDSDGRLNRDNARVEQWLAVEMIFQLTGEELASGEQLRLLMESPAFSAQTYRSFLFFAVELGSKPNGRPYARGELATITREINKLFTMPVSVVFRYRLDDAPALTLAIVTHRPNLRDGSRDVLEKVSLIRDVRPVDPHRAHVEILADLALPTLQVRQATAGFNDLQRAWARTLDISELNRRFYREIANWYFWAVSEVEFPDDGTLRARRNADRVIRLITRLIFIWFLREKGLVDWRLFRRTEVEPLLVSLNDDESSYYKAILQNLFFGTLNQEMGRRAFRRDGQNYGVFNLYRHKSLFKDADKALDLFAHVPFLNGGLFECLDDFDQKPPVRVDAFSDRPDSQPRVPNYLFFTAEAQPFDLNNAYGTRGRRYEVRGILEILERYKFTIAENTPVEEDVALDPELLGQVFENLLAAYNPETETTARKETGSFYTPRNVVAYMVDESLLLYLRDHLTKAAPLIARADESGQASLDARLRRLLAYNDHDPRDDFSDEERRHLILAIDTLTSIDPACGSGAFPMGMLQKLVYLLGKLDPRNLGWKERQLARARQIPDPMARQAAEESIKEAFERNDLDYGRKLFLIENGIYGVDIQPIAVQIAKLRCFISLVVDQQVHDDRPNRGIRPLPNLETKFVAADALTSVERPAQLAFRDPDIEATERELRDVRSQHFSARTPATKNRYRERDKELRAQLGGLLRRNGFSGEAAAALAAWDPYSQNRFALFFDPEWMFGRDEGFDIVIANPPYVRQEQIKERKPALAKRYSTYTGTADLYVYFYERAVQLLRTGGVLTFISSNKFFRAGYGQKLRGYLATGATIHQVIDFGDAPLFTAIAYPSIVIAQKAAPPADHQLLALSWNPAERLEALPRITADAHAAIAQRTPAAPLVLQRSLTAEGWRLEGAATQRLLEKLRRAGQPLGDYVGGRFYRGVGTGFNEAFVIDEVTRNRLIAEHSSSAEVIKPFLRGRDVKRWRVQPQSMWLIFLPWHFPLHTNASIKEASKEAEREFAKSYPAIYNHLLSFKPDLEARDKTETGIKYEWYALQRWRPESWQEFERPKIVYPDIYEHQSFAYDKNKFFMSNTCYFIPTDEVWMTGLLNSTAVEWFYSLTSNRIRGGYLRAFSDYMGLIPIPPSADTAPLRGLVERVLALKAKNPKADVSDVEREIDERVYALYGLDVDEVRQIEAEAGAVGEVARGEEEQDERS